MLYIDYLAYNNNLKNISICEKVLLTGGGLVLAIAASSPLTPIIIFIIMQAVMLYAGIPVRYMVKLWMIPLPFIAVSLLTSIISISMEPFASLATLTIGPYYLGITQSGFLTAGLVGLRSVAAIACMYALATTTPIAHLVSYGAKIPSLKAVAEITLLAYRFIFVVLETSGRIYTAQQARLGYHAWRPSLRSIILLAANLGTNAFITSKNLYTALQARNYNEQLIFRTYQSPVVIYRVIIISISLILLFFTINR